MTRYGVQPHGILYVGLFLPIIVFLAAAIKQKLPKKCAPRHNSKHTMVFVTARVHSVYRSSLGGFGDMFPGKHPQTSFQIQTRAYIYYL